MKKLNILMSRLDEINKALGGKEDTVVDKNKKNLSEYEEALLFARTKLKEAEDKVNERFRIIELHGYQDSQRIKIDSEIRKLSDEAEQAINQLDNLLRGMRRKNKGSFSNLELKNKEKIFELMKQQLQMLKEDASSGNPVNKVNNNLHLKEIKIDLMGNAGKKVEDQRDLNEEERDALKRFKENDLAIDEILGEIIDDLDLLHEKAKNIDVGIDRQKQLLQKVGKKAQGTKATMETTNKRLKKIIFQYSKPSKMCFYVFLLIILIGLICIFYNQIKDDI